MRLRFFLAAAVMFSISLVARADSLLYNFTFSGSGYSGSGTFSLTPDSNPGEYVITGLTGTTTLLGETSSSIAALLPAGTFPENSNDFPDQANDNLAFLSGPFLDYQGFSYQLSNGEYVNVFYGFGTSYGIVSGDGDSFLLSTFTVTPAATPVLTPEPSSFLLFATGLLGAALLLRKRFLQERKAAAFASGSSLPCA